MQSVGQRRNFAEEKCRNIDSWGEFKKILEYEKPYDVKLMDKITIHTIQILSNCKLWGTKTLIWPTKMANAFSGSLTHSSNPFPTCPLMERRIIKRAASSVLELKNGSSTGPRFQWNWIDYHSVICFLNFPCFHLCKPTCLGFYCKSFQLLPSMSSFIIRYDKIVIIQCLLEIPSQGIEDIVKKCSSQDTYSQYTQIGHPFNMLFIFPSTSTPVHCNDL